MKTLDRFGVEIHETKLNNGMRVFLFKRKGMPISLEASFFAGSRFDKIPGTAHFLEHMLVAGTKDFPTKNLISDYLKDIGGDFGASTSNDMLRIWLEIPESTDFWKGVKVLEEILLYPRMDAKTIETERGSIYSEIADRKSHPSSYIWEVMRRLLLQGTVAGNSVLGNSESLKSIDKETLLKHKENYINTSRGVYVVSGDIEMNELCNQLEKINLPISNQFEKPRKLPVIRKEIEDIEQYPDVNQLQVVLANRIDIENYREDCSLRVLLNILGKGRGSRLITKLRYEKGLVYGVFASYITAPDWNGFYVKMSCDKKDLELAKKVVVDIFDDLKKNGITKEEFEKTKSGLIKSSIPNFQTSDNWVDFHSYDALFEPDDMETPEDFINEMGSLTLDDIGHAIDKFLRPEEFYTAICGNLKDTKSS